jgi:O-antigen ligase
MAGSRRFLWVGRAAPVVAVVGIVTGITVGATAAFSSAVAVGFAFALAAQLDNPGRGALVGQIANAVLLAVPGLLVIALAFNGGGYFPEAPAVAALAIAFLLLLRALFADDPFEGFSPLLLVAVGALGLYCLWVLISFTWSHAPGRAFTETSRALLYLLLLILFGSLGRSSARVRWMVRGVVAGIAVVCICALITRVLPHVWPITPNIVNNRLSYPITYWNTLGLLAAIGCVLGLHLTCSLQEPASIRIVVAAVLPLIASTLLFTFSRGSIAAVAIGLGVYVLVGRPRGLVSGLLSAGPATAVALVVAYDADLLATSTPTTAGAVAQGHHVAIVTALCVAGAAILRTAALPLDAHLRRVRLSAPAKRALRLAQAGAGVALVVVLIAAGAPHRINTQYHRFVSAKAPAGQQTRQRLTDPSNNGRLINWKVAMREFRESKLHGAGAGTYALVWAEHRPAAFAGLQVVNAHSIYVENLSDLGIVGFALIIGVLLALLVGIAARLRGPRRSLYAALLASLLGWAFEAGLDWQWQMPVVTGLLFALGGLALARPPRSKEDARRRRLATRVAAVLACGGLAVIPLLVAISQAHLDDSISYFQQQNCPSAETSARSAIAALGVRAEPYQILGYCAIQDGHPQAAVAALHKAVKRDPNNWEYRYSLAVADAAAGQDPYPDIRRAQRLGPYQVLADDAAELFDTRYPSVWQRRAPLAPLPDELTP